MCTIVFLCGASFVTVLWTSCVGIFTGPLCGVVVLLCLVQPHLSIVTFLHYQSFIQMASHRQVVNLYCQRRLYLRWILCCLLYKIVKMKTRLSFLKHSSGSNQVLILIFQLKTPRICSLGTFHHRI